MWDCVGKGLGGQLLVTVFGFALEEFFGTCSILKARKEQSETESIQNRSQLCLLSVRRLDTEEQSQKFLLLKWRGQLSSHWADYCKPQTRPALSQTGSDLVKLPVENCLQRTLLFAFIVPSPESNC